MLEPDGGCGAGVGGRDVGCGSLEARKVTGVWFGRMHLGAWECSRSSPLGVPDASRWKPGVEKRVWDQVGV